MIRPTLIAAALVMLSGQIAMADQTAITNTLTDIAAGADRHDWARVQNAFAETVTADYTSLWGGTPAITWSPTTPSQASTQTAPKRRPISPLPMFWMGHIRFWTGGMTMLRRCPATAGS